MDGHGALTIALENPESFVSVSAFSPICAPTHCAWGQKAFTNYLGGPSESWLAYDTVALVGQAKSRHPVLVDQGTADNSLEEQLKTPLLVEACRLADYPMTIRKRGTMSAPSNSAPDPVQAAIAAWQDQPGPLLPVLHAVQDSLGYIPREAINTIAAALRLTRAEVSGVISFYHHFHVAPAGRHRVEVCRAEACQAVGARQLEAHAKMRLGLDYHETGADGQFSLEPVYCLGNCACGPSIRIGDAVHGRVSEARFDELLAALDTQVLELQG